MNISWLSLSAARKQLSQDGYANLADSGSLTHRIRTKCPDSFKVKLIGHKTIRPDHQECSLLNLPESVQALSRQVFLCCDGKPLIFARTIIGLVEKNRALTERIATLGEYSLGSILFRDPLARKCQMQLAYISLDHEFFKDVDLTGTGSDDDIWMRRSLYDYEGCNLIVYEAFLR